MKSVILFADGTSEMLMFLAATATTRGSVLALVVVGCMGSCFCVQARKADGVPTGCRLKGKIRFGIMLLARPARKGD